MFYGASSIVWYIMTIINLTGIREICLTRVVLQDKHVKF